MKLVSEDKQGWRKKICINLLPCGPFEPAYVHNMLYKERIIVLKQGAKYDASCFYEIKEWQRLGLTVC